MLRIYAEHNPAHFKGGNFYLREKITAVDQIESIYFSLIFIRPFS